MVACLNIGGGLGNLYRIISDNVVEDDKNNAATITYDGQNFCFYFNDQLIGNLSINQKRTPGDGKLEIAPIGSNSLRQGIQKLYIADKAMLPGDVSDQSVLFKWIAPPPEYNLQHDVQKIIHSVGPDKKYWKHFIFSSHAKQQN